MSNSESKTQRTRAHILDVAWKLIAERGLDVGMSEIASEVGLTRQSVHLHFRTRGGLLIGLVRRADEREDIHARFLEALSNEDPHRRFEAFLRVWFDFASKIRPVASQLIAARRSDAAADAAWSDRMNELRDGFLGLTTSLRRDGVLAQEWTAPSAADYLWAAVSIQSLELLSVERGWGDARTRKILRRVLAKGIFE